MTDSPQRHGQSNQPEESEIYLRIDLGPGHQLADLSELLQNITTIVDFGTRLHEKSVRYAAFQQLIPEFIEGGAEVVSWFYLLGPEWIDRLYAINRDFAIHAEDVIRSQELAVAVNELSYRNPFTIRLSVSLFSESFVKVLEIVRDWKADKRIKQAQAADFEAAVTARARVRQHLVDQIVREGSTSLTPSDVKELLTPQVVLAIEAVGNTNPDIEAAGERLPE